MDVLLFLKDRTRFIEHYYESVCAPFLEIHRKIDAKEPPYAEVPYGISEDQEPAYFTEWSWAQNGLLIAGRSCVTLLAGTLQHYLEAWQRELSITLDEADLRFFKKKGWLPGYRMVFELFLGVPWTTSPADLSVLEEVVIARNADQHRGNITSIDAYLPHTHTKRFANSLFISDRHERLFGEADDIFASFFPPELVVSRDALFKGIEEVEKLAVWLEPMLHDLKWGRWIKPEVLGG